MCATPYDESTPYYYYKNFFGDVLGIMDSCGNVVVRYYYDAWGNIISTTGSMASTLGRDNPFRYRGYYYDTETGFYYLNARYYNPEWGRFISADPVLDTSNAIGCNMFAYCDNNPVNKADYTGEDAIVLIENDAAMKCGHIGIMFQDEYGCWWHFYWATPGLIFQIASFLGSNTPHNMSLDQYRGNDVSLSAINNSGIYKGTYDRYIYLEGDFSKAMVPLQTDYSEFYNLYANNCSQQSLSALAYCDTEYKETLIGASNRIIPKYAFSYILGYTNLTKYTYWGPTKAKPGTPQRVDLPE